ncbi:DUF1127 domain-containing protein [Tropicibacter sp. Alg240-R139]|uniref:DUF1127 domain-containing protein n=1 Tax=Tropicibacter sp. Alg240-R139 TaxID=2305991 RepID=UPI0013E0316E|nr:DUF1127 domain-containing protein [Tropicibacter sp. Alg240-R139]
MAVTSDYTAAKGATFSGFSSLIEAAKTRYIRNRMYRRTVNELSALSEHELADLGLHRSMIKRIAQQTSAEYAAR